MRREDHLFKTMSAVRCCLDACRQAPAPLTTLERFLQELRRDPKWDDNEIEEVERAARQAIRSQTGRQPC
jgi:hypothetical protein